MFISTREIQFETYDNAFEGNLQMQLVRQKLSAKACRAPAKGKAGNKHRYIILQGMHEQIPT